MGEWKATPVQHPRSEHIAPHAQQATPPVVRWWHTLRTARWIWTPVWMFVVTRLGIAMIAYIAAATLPDPSHALPPAAPQNLLLDVFTNRWDSGFYIGIAEHGSAYPSALPLVAFFPLLPLLIRAVAVVTGDAALAGLVLTNGSLLLAAMVLYRLVRAAWSETVAERAVWYMLIFPTSFYASAVYTEPVYLLAAVAALWCARRERWIAAGMMGTAATLVRPVGVLVAPLVFLEWWTRRHQHHPARRSWTPLLAALLPCAALGTYMLYLRWTYGDPLAFVHAQAAWGRQESPWALLNQLVQAPPEGWRAAFANGTIPFNPWIDAMFTIGFALLGAVLLVERRWSEGAFVLLNIAVEVNAGLWMAQRRHVWVLFPALILLARWGERPWVDRLITTSFLLWLAWFTAIFANWYWVA